MKDYREKKVESRTLFVCRAARIMLHAKRLLLTLCLTVGSAAIVSAIAAPVAANRLCSPHIGSDEGTVADDSIDTADDNVNTKTVTFDATVEKADSAGAGEWEITKNGVTIHISNGMMGNGVQYRCYKGETLTVSAKTDTIVKIVFTCVGSDTQTYGPGNFETVDATTGVADSSYTYSGKVGTWTGEATEMAFIAASRQVRITRIDVTLCSSSGGEEPIDTVVTLNAAEWKALATLYADLSSNFGYTPTWDFSQGVSAANSFEGIEIENGHVVSLNFSYKGLTGLFPTSVFAFPQLAKLNLSNNKLSGNLPTVLMAVYSQSPTSTQSLTDLNVRSNAYSGNLGILAQCLPALTSLYADNNAFEDVYPVIPSRVTNLSIANQHISRVVSVDLPTVSLASLATQFPTILIYDHANQGYETNFSNLYVMCSNVDVYSIEEDPSKTIIYEVTFTNGQFSYDCTSEENAYYGQSGDALYAWVYNGDADGSAFKVKLTFDQGDANFSGKVDASDLQATILYAFGSYSEKPFNFTAANTYADEQINVQDVVCTTNLLLASMNNESATASTKRQTAFTDDSATPSAYLYTENGRVLLHTECPVAALSVKARGSIAWTLDALGLTQATDVSNVVAYSLTGGTLPVGTTVIGTCDESAVIESATMANAEAQSLVVATSKQPATAISTIKQGSEVDGTIYDLQGRRRNAMERGINLIKQGSRTIKIFKK